jgi:hypothetical protein
VSQRDNMRNPQSTHRGLGIAVEPGDEALLYATQIFVQLAREIDVAAAPARVLALLGEARQGRGLPALRSDARLDEVAQAAAREFFLEPTPTDAQIVQRANQRLAPLGATSREVGTVTGVVRTLEEATALEPSLDLEAKAIGIGVAQGHRADAGPHAIAVVVIWAR